MINQLEFSEKELPAQRLRGLVAGLQNVRAGEKRRVAVSADEAYGTYDPALQVTVSRSELPQGRIQVGAEVLGYAKDGPERRPFRVVKIQGDQVTLDANHPLAGEDLVFEVEVTDARDAEEEDLKQAFVLGSPNRVH